LIGVNAPVWYFGKLDRGNSISCGAAAMAYKTVLVSLNDVPRVEPMLEAAARIARICDAHLIGCYVIPAVTIYPEVGFASPPALDDTRQQYFKANVAAVKARFETMLRKEGLKGEWRTVGSLYTEIAPSLMEHGRAADLIMVSQIAQDPVAYIEPGLVDHVVMESGRPVLMVPQKGALAEIKSVVAGFNATREAARALFDSLPLLQGVKEVRVVWVDPYKERSVAGEVPGAEAAAALARHAIKATAEGLAAGGVNAGEALLQHANDLGAGLLVVGAYAHSRMREYIFGGATQHVLAHANIPVLLSH
jgi:nucleotide-binding universal stress UspA family protein